MFDLSDAERKEKNGLIRSEKKRIFRRRGAGIINTRYQPSLNIVHLIKCRALILEQLSGLNPLSTNTHFFMKR